LIKVLLLLLLVVVVLLLLCLKTWGDLGECTGNLRPGEWLLMKGRRAEVLLMLDQEGFVIGLLLEFLNCRRGRLCMCAVEFVYE